MNKLFKYVMGVIALAAIFLIGAISCSSEDQELSQAEKDLALLRRGAITGYILRDKGMPIEDIPDVVTQLYIQGQYD